MPTIFSVPKAFTGSFSRIQTNAIRSWLELPTKPEVVLFGDEDGVAEHAVRLGVRHAPVVERNDQGTPLLSDVFERVNRIVNDVDLCFVNTDIILMPDFADAWTRVSRWSQPYLMVGKRCNVDVPFEIDPGSDWVPRIRQLASGGDTSSAYWIDYFAFTQGVFGSVPPFAIGRPGYDNWLIWRARSRGVPVVDASREVLAVHQRHDYSHVDYDDQLATVGHALSRGEEAARNRDLLGDWRRLQTIDHSSHVLTTQGVRRAFGGRYLLARAHLSWRWIVVMSRPLRHLIGIRRSPGHRSDAR